jgi:hypothetical protein
MNNNTAIEFGTAVMKLGSKVAGIATVKVSRGKRGMIEEPAIIACDVTEEMRVGLGLMYVQDYGFSGHKLFAIA